MTMTLRYFRVTFYHQDFRITTTIDNLNMSTVDENTDVTTAQATHDICYVASLSAFFGVGNQFNLDRFESVPIGCIDNIVVSCIGELVHRPVLLADGLGFGVCCLVGHGILF